MINPKQITAQPEENIPQTDKLHQVEDAALKTMAQFFKDELLPYFHIEGEVDHIAPTEIVHLELKKFYQDFNFVMKDGSWIHFEFQSSDTKALEDLKRFRCYEALVSYQHKVDVHTYVLFSGNIENPMIEYTSGYNTYRVHPIIMKGRLAEEVFDNINYKLDHSIPLTKEDFIPLMLCPLMGGNLSQKERFRKGFGIIYATKNVIETADKLEAILFAMANKFLNETEFNNLKEEMKMTELGLFLYNDGKADGIAEGISQGISQEAFDNAKSFLKNGVSYELVRKSIKNISDKELQEIYDEVMAEKAE